MKKFYSFLLTLAIFLLTQSQSYAQYIGDIMGRPFELRTYTDVEGSPYLTDGWSKGTALLKNGKSFKENLYLKFDEMNNEILFKGKNDEPLVFVDPVTEFTLTYTDKDVTPNKHYKKGFKNIPETTEDTFIQVIADGKLQILKHVKVTIYEIKEYNTAVVKKRFERYPKYYMVIRDTVKPFKNDRGSLLKALGDKQKEVEAYIKSKNLNPKNDSDLSEIGIYYNSI